MINDGEWVINDIKTMMFNAIDKNIFFARDYIIGETPRKNEGIPSYRHNARNDFRFIRYPHCPPWNIPCTTPKHSKRGSIKNGRNFFPIFYILKPDINPANNPNNTRQYLFIERFFERFQ